MGAVLGAGAAVLVVVGVALWVVTRLFPAGGAPSSDLDATTTVRPGAPGRLGDIARPD